jgi:hypothetical protein
MDAKITTLKRSGFWLGHDGILVFGWIAAVVVGLVHNQIIGRQRRAS